MATRVQIVMDCADPARLSDFWALALGYVVQPPPEGFTSWQEWVQEQGWPEQDWNSAGAILDPDGVGPRIYFQRVPEGKHVKNRVHLDLNVSGGRDTSFDERRQRIDAKAEELKGAGAKVLRVQDRPPREPDYYGIVMQDPEGNELCVQ